MRETGDRRRETGDGRQETGDRRRRTEVGGRRTEVGGLEDGGLEDGGRRSEVGGLERACSKALHARRVVTNAATRALRVGAGGTSGRPLQSIPLCLPPRSPRLRVSLRPTGAAGPWRTVSGEGGGDNPRGRWADLDTNLPDFHELLGVMAFPSSASSSAEFMGAVERNCSMIRMPAGRYSPCSRIRYIMVRFHYLITSLPRALSTPLSTTAPAAETPPPDTPACRRRAIARTAGGVSTRQRFQCDSAPHSAVIPARSSAFTAAAIRSTAARKSAVRPPCTAPVKYRAALPRPHAGGGFCRVS